MRHFKFMEKVYINNGFYEGYTGTVYDIEEDGDYIVLIKFSNPYTRDDVTRELTLPAKMLDLQVQLSSGAC